MRERGKEGERGGYGRMIRAGSSLKGNFISVTIWKMPSLKGKTASDKSGTIFWATFQHNSSHCRLQRNMSKYFPKK